MTILQCATSTSIFTFFHNRHSIRMSAHEADGLSLQETSDSTGAPTKVSLKRKAIEISQDAPDHCVICLCPITERAITVPCNHSSFDFVCLANWLEHRSTCPLCTAEISKVEYDWASPTDFKSFVVKSTQATASTSSNPSSSLRSNPTSEGNSSTFRARQHRPRPIQWGPSSSSSGPDPGVAIQRRREVYRSGLYSLHIGSNSQSRHHDYTPSQFSESSHLQSRAKLWIRRELQVFSFLNTSSESSGSSSLPPNAEFLLHYLIAILKTCDIKDSAGHAEDLLSEFLGRENARLFLHELHAWLRSPYAKLEDWDRHVQYPTGGKALQLRRPRGEEDRKEENTQDRPRHTQPQRGKQPSTGSRSRRRS